MTTSVKQLLGAGTNNIPVAACAEMGIPVFNSPGANANTVKELILCTLLLTTVATRGQKGDNGNHNVQKRHGRNKEQHHGASSILLERSSTRIFIVIESGRDHDFGSNLFVPES
jgi:lactate dehydrogenase-like 2-hydroxyacid dehydrogenase